VITRVISAANGRLNTIVFVRASKYGPCEPRVTAIVTSRGITSDLLSPAATSLSRLALIRLTRNFSSAVRGCT
jgi:hypothetical protein